MLIRIKSFVAQPHTAALVLLGTVLFIAILYLRTDGTQPALRRIRIGYPVSGFALSQDGQLIAATGGLERVLQLWEFRVEAVHLRWQDTTDEAWGVAFSPDGQTLAIAGETAVRLVRVHDARTIQTFRGQRNGAGVVAFSPDGQILAALGYQEADVLLWRIRDGQLLHRFAGTASQALRPCLAFSPDGRLLAASNADDGNIVLWDTSDARELRTLSGHTSNISGLVFSPDGSQLISSSWDGSVRFWNVSGGQLDRIIRTGQYIMSMAVSPDQRLIATASGEAGIPYENTRGDKTIRVWESMTGEGVEVVQAHTKRINALAFHPDRGRLISASWDGTIKIWPTP